MTRRSHLAALCGLSAGATACQERTEKVNAGTKRGRIWHGFNLQEKFTDRPDEWLSVEKEWARSNEAFREEDFELIAELGFNYVRLPMSYRCWCDPADPYRLIEKPLREIDQAVEWGRQYGLHVCLNFHRAPGYCINENLSPEPWNLWEDAKALDLAAFQWRHFAERYREVPSTRLSFNLINEPSRRKTQQYVNVVRRLAADIRSLDPDRMLVIDGLFGEATGPAPELADLSHTVQSTRGYAPFTVSHYRAPWGGKLPDLTPEWPMQDRILWDRSQLQRWCIEPWAPIEKQGIPVFVGEWGCWKETPHAVALRWMRDNLALWKAAGWGWALWCFRGSFGILNSGRRDVRYRRWKGHQLDAEMLDLLKQFV